MELFIFLILLLIFSLYAHSSFQLKLSDEKRKYVKAIQIINFILCSLAFITRIWYILIIVFILIIVLMIIAIVSPSKKF